MHRLSHALNDPSDVFFPRLCSSSSPQKLYRPPPLAARRHATLPAAFPTLRPPITHPSPTHRPPIAQPWFTPPLRGESRRRTSSPGATSSASSTRFAHCCSPASCELAVAGAIATTGDAADRLQQGRARYGTGRAGCAAVAAVRAAAAAAVCVAAAAAGVAAAASRVHAVAHPIAAAAAVGRKKGGGGGEEEGGSSVRRPMCARVRAGAAARAFD
ncbi:unnamed protein product [Closterium sp. NIES-64]|nr:unnamed protein product [Closterium sp. NIES-64]